ncbi:hypothetical protein [Caulobacter sp. DWP3-1-3b2]|uniref:hypothetical protein n=1 Tax=Caulobacter sp. DWP3-1-3b2 TaxID=2804643 RepID=UPI003CEAE3D7
MNTGERLIEAHRIVAEAGPALVLGNEPASGYTFLARVALQCAAKRVPPEEIAGWAERFAADLRQTLD